MTFLQRPEIAPQTVRPRLLHGMGVAPQRQFETGGEILPFTGHETHAPRGLRQLEGMARELAWLGPPVVVFNASHSGSRLLASLLERFGVFMGANLNESEDSLDMFELVRYVVQAHAPDFSKFFAEGDPALSDRVQYAMTSHLEGRRPGQPWGWKLPETGHVLPVISQLFPEARFIHLLRDGRDVAFSPFLAPKDPFWRKIYFNDDRIGSWRGHAMTQRAYRAHGHVFNAARWVNSVTLGRAHGAMLGERYLELRYEALVENPAAELGRLAAFLGVKAPPQMLDPGEVRTQSVGKWKAKPAREIDEVRAVLEPTLGAFGYDWESPSVGHHARSALANIGETARSWVSTGSRAEPGGLGGLFRIRGRR